MLLLFFKDHPSHSALYCDISVELSPLAVKSMFWLRSGPITLQEITYPDLVEARTEKGKYLFKPLVSKGPYFLRIKLTAKTVDEDPDRCKRWISRKRYLISQNIKKNEKSKDYCKADLKQRVLFFITIFICFLSVAMFWPLLKPVKFYRFFGGSLLSGIVAFRPRFLKGRLALIQDYNFFYIFVLTFLCCP